MRACVRVCVCVVFVVAGEGGAFFVVFSIPPTVLTSEALLPRRSSRHSYPRPHPRLIPHRGPAARGPQDETSGRWRAAI